MGLQGPGDLAVGIGVDHIGRREPRLGVHAHVERSVVAETEASFGPVELGGTDTQVEEEARQFGDPSVGADGAEFVESGSGQLHPVFESGESSRRRFDGSRITIDPQQAQSRTGVEDRGGMAGPAERGIEKDPGRNRRRGLDDLGKHHRPMNKLDW